MKNFNRVSTLTSTLWPNSKLIADAFCGFGRRAYITYTYFDNFLTSPSPMSTTVRFDWSFDIRAPGSESNGRKRYQLQHLKKKSVGFQYLIRIAKHIWWVTDPRLICACTAEYGSGYLILWQLFPSTYFILFDAIWMIFRTNPRQGPAKHLRSAASSLQWI